MNLGLKELMTHYNTDTGLWNTEGWWNAANSVTVLANANAFQRDQDFSGIFENTFARAQQRFPQFRNEYYDDEGWWALAWIRAFDVTHRDEYLTMAQSIFDDMAGGWDHTCSGGIWWKKDRHYKNAIANELFLSVAAHLATRTKGANQRSYLKWARREWKWFRVSGMINAENLVNDGLTEACKNNLKRTWSYNQGMIIGGLVELSRITGDTKLLTQAQSIAQAAIAHLADSNLVLHDPTEPRCSEDTRQFKGIFVRNLVELEQAVPANEYEKFIRANADSIWKTAHTESDEFSCRWSGPPTADGAAASTSALDTLVAAATLNNGFLFLGDHQAEGYCGGNRP